jgi:hypothetical protein
VRVTATAAPSNPPAAVKAVPHSPATSNPAAHATLPGRLDRDRAIAEARSKVMWGEDKKDIAAFLRMQGIPAQEATQILEQLLGERAATIRAEGLAKIFKGAACACVPIIAFFSFMAMAYFPIYPFGATLVVGCYGLYLLFNGFFMFVSPRSEGGDVADK